ncbi:tripartite motif-containing protein 16-like [Polypterus senegalus]|uniref:tripartite motif-containing protein 16-like n=1 Tax=Polypterus senegalus TaxID=55291 RepID=UPI00196392C9|nr:tripartite motif-containing protein 16-like [Polypterus senegalus]
MAQTSISVSQDQFTCPVCLEIVVEPVTIPCGHNYCMRCLSGYWDQSEVYSCPQCRETFITRPALCRNVMLADVAEKLRESKLHLAKTEWQTERGEVLCDECAGTKKKAVQTCLTCLASYCETHIQPHWQFETMKRHKLEKPMENLHQKICSKHQRLMELYCKTDQSCICSLCVATKHRNHDTVTPDMERTEKQKQMAMTKREIQKKLQQKQKRLEEVKDYVCLIKNSVDREVQQIEKSLSDLICCLKETLGNLMKKMREQEEKEVAKAEEIIERIEKDIQDLKRSDTELTELSETDDDIIFLQTFTSFCVPSGSRESLSFVLTAPCFTENLKKELSCLKERLENFSFQEIVKFIPVVSDVPLSPLFQTRHEFLRYSFQLTLDPNTMNKELSLSERNRKVTRGRKMQYGDHPDRFEHWRQVLCRQGIIGIRCYWEVEWIGKGASIGVAYKGICRKGKAAESGLGGNDKSWSVDCSTTRYSVWHNNKETQITAPLCHRVGVYLDCPAGCVSFYIVSEDTMTLLYRFKASFTEPLYPGFGIGVDSSLIICHI